jgi:hypothetical protein
VCQLSLALSLSLSLAPPPLLTYSLKHTLTHSHTHTHTHTHTPQEVIGDMLTRLAAQPTVDTSNAGVEVGKKKEQKNLDPIP